ncbi:hypothetical protein NC651_008754 [Populus alba x Populus x berolinensis]|nr:hypothetical protein NC651_008754 [Populus alba x Populus x berolinensis]
MTTLKLVIFVLQDELSGFEEAWKGNAGKHLLDGLEVSLALITLGEGEKFTLYLGSVKVYKIFFKFQLVLILLADKSSQSTSLELCVGTSSSGQNAQARRGGWALPSSEGSQHSKRMMPDTTVGAGSSHIQKSGRRKGSSDVKDMNSYPRWKPNN